MAPCFWAMYQFGFRENSELSACFKDFKKNATGEDINGTQIGSIQVANLMVATPLS
jgi:hypothetical protein